MILCSLSAFSTWRGTPTKNRQNGRFRVDYTSLLQDLSAELEAIGAKNVELGMDIPEGKLRRSMRSFDGWPKTDTPVTMPGVILRFDRRDRPMEFACDQYTYWQDNLRGISLTLEALRAIARYGATQHNEQYRGYERQIAAGPAPVQIESTVAAASILLYAAMDEGRTNIEKVLVDPDFAKAVVREALKRTHPDAGGNAEDFMGASGCADQLRKHHGGAL